MLDVEDVYVFGFRGFVVVIFVVVGGFNYEFRVSVFGYGVDNGLNRLFVLGGFWIYILRRGREE